MTPKKPRAAPDAAEHPLLPDMTMVVSVPVDWEVDTLRLRRTVEHGTIILELRTGLWAATASLSRATVAGLQSVTPEDAVRSLRERLLAAVKNKSIFKKELEDTCQQLL